MQVNRYSEIQATLEPVVENFNRRFLEFFFTALFFLSSTILEQVGRDKKIKPRKKDQKATLKFSTTDS